MSRSISPKQLYFSIYPCLRPVGNYWAGYVVQLGQLVRRIVGPTGASYSWVNFCVIQLGQLVRRIVGPTCASYSWANQCVIQLGQLVRHIVGPTCASYSWANQCVIQLGPLVRQLVRHIVVIVVIVYSAKEIFGVHLPQVLRGQTPLTFDEQESGIAKIAPNRMYLCTKSHVSLH